MRIILYTGKGGVGKTSIAAASAVQSAKSGNYQSTAFPGLNIQLYGIFSKI
jgi:arsenite efflux ATP-binding protein ArsA (TC 3.A.4.1.1)